MTDLTHSAIDANANSTAAVFRTVGRPLSLESIELPVPKGEEALVRIDCCTLCGSDLHTLTGARSSPIPSVLGHEIVGTVEAAGDIPLRDVDGQSVVPGDRITWSVAVSCHRCDRCLRGMPQKCRELAKYGHEVFQGRYALSGGLAQHLLLRPGSTVVKLPRELPDQVACPANCATATVAAAFRVAQEVKGARVLILGAGMLGLTAAAFARNEHAAHVAVCDRDSERLALSNDLGADSTCLWESDPIALQDNLEQATGERLFDVIFEFSGSPEAVERACELGDVGSRVVLVGTVMPTRPVSIDPEQVVRRWQSIQGVHNYAPQDLKRAVEFLGQHHSRFPFANMVSKTFALNHVNDAIEFAVQNRPIRVAVRPSDVSSA